MKHEVMTPRQIAAALSSTALFSPFGSPQPRPHRTLQHWGPDVLTSTLVDTDRPGPSRAAGGQETHPAASVGTQRPAARRRKPVAGEPDVVTAFPVFREPAAAGVPGAGCWVLGAVGSFARQVAQRPRQPTGLGRRARHRRATEPPRGRPHTRAEATQPSVRLHVPSAWHFPSLSVDDDLGWSSQFGAFLAVEAGPDAGHHIAPVRWNAPRLTRLRPPKAAPGEIQSPPGRSRSLGGRAMMPKLA